MADLMTEIAEKVIEGDPDGVKELTQKAIDEQRDVEEILNKGLLAGMDVVGVRFRDGELFIPEVLVRANALGAGRDLLKPLIIKSGIKPIAKFVIGTVKGDIHEIGKSLVAMMLEGSGFEVVDLGTDVSAEKFVEAVKQEKPQILAMSSLLTTTMGEMGLVIETLKEEGLLDKVKTMVGGAPISQSFADEIGADGYASDGLSAAAKAKELLA